MTADTLREAIFSMHFKPNERLVERDLCVLTGVSRTCVREALRHLESEGLVERRSNKSLTVASLSAEEAQQIYEVRAALEAAMGRLFTERATAADITSLRAALAEFERTVDAPPIGAYVNAIDRFYEVLMRGSGNDVARRILRTLHARITYLRTITTARAGESRRHETRDLLRGIAEAAVRRDGEAVAQRCEAFVRRSAAFALQVLRDGPG